MALSSLHGITGWCPAGIAHGKVRCWCVVGHDPARPEADIPEPAAGGVPLRLRPRAAGAGAAQLGPVGAHGESADGCCRQAHLYGERALSLESNSPCQCAWYTLPSKPPVRRLSRMDCATPCHKHCTEPPAGVHDGVCNLLELGARRLALGRTQVSALTAPCCAHPAAVHPGAGGVPVHRLRPALRRVLGAPGLLLGTSSTHNCSGSACCHCRGCTGLHP